MLAANLDVLRRHDPGVRVTVIGRNATGVAERYGVAALAAPPAASLDAATLPGRSPRPWMAPAASSSPGAATSARPGRSCCASASFSCVRPGGGATDRDRRPDDRSRAGRRGTGRAGRGPGRSRSPRGPRAPSAALALRTGMPAGRLAYQPDDAFFLAGRAPAAEVPGIPEGPFLAVTLDSTFPARAFAASPSSSPGSPRRAGSPWRSSPTSARSAASVRTTGGPAACSATCCEPRGPTAR